MTRPALRLVNGNASCSRCGEAIGRVVTEARVRERHGHVPEPYGADVLVLSAPWHPGADGVYRRGRTRRPAAGSRHPSASARGARVSALLDVARRARHAADTRQPSLARVILTIYDASR